MNTASIYAHSAEHAEEVAIALAVTCNPRATILTDSQQASRNFARGTIDTAAANLLKKSDLQTVHIVWTPGQMGHHGRTEGNWSFGLEAPTQLL